MSQTSTYPGLARVHKAMSEKYGHELDHGYVVRLVGEIKMLWNKGKGLSMQDALERVLKKHRNRRKDFPQYEDLLRTYCAEGPEAWFTKRATCRQ